MREDPDAAEDMLTTLSDLLRLTLARGDRKEVPLRDDMALLDRYLEIHQIRLGERLTVTSTIAPGTYDLMIPSFILQPVVENAIRHGIARRRVGGRLELRAGIEGDALHLVVRNDGPGLPQGIDIFREKGIGLANVRSRLVHLYGRSQALTVVDTPDGVEVTIVLPVRTAAMAGAE
jgi:LytS/YehU family sensor histidine kinase